jgi:triphosphatase
MISDSLPGTDAAGLELEFKWRLTPAGLRVLRSTGHLAGRPRIRHMVATYYDTPDALLWRNRVALRVRREGRRWIQTLKGGGMALGGLQLRRESNVPVPAGRLALDQIPSAHDPAGLFRDPAVRERLMPVFSTDFHRESRILTLSDGAQVELALDRGEIRAGRRRMAIQEIELELTEGTIDDLLTFADDLRETVRLVTETRSKAERGYLLSGLVHAGPVRAEHIHLSPRLTLPQALCTIAGEAVAQIQANTPGVLAGKDPEYLHQWRVGLRRLRSLLRLGRDAGYPELAQYLRHLRPLAEASGDVRDWDVFLGAVTGPEAQRAAEARHQAHRRLSRLLRAKDYDRDMLALIARLIALTRQSSGRPLTVAVRKLLRRQLAAVLRHAGQPAWSPVDRLHRLRIRVKRLRYTLEFFRDFFEAAHSRPLHEALQRLQDILGDMHDLSNACKKDRVLEDGPSGTRRRARWQRRLKLELRPALRDTWRRFRRIDTDWMHDG